MQKFTIIITIFVTLSANAQKPDIFLLKAITLLQDKNYTPALEILQTLENQDASLIQKLKGDCYYGMQDFTNAELCYQKANNQATGFTTLEIARTYAKQGNNSLGLSWLEKYLTQKNKKTEYDLVTDEAFSGIDKTNEWKAIWKKEWYTAAEVQSNALQSILKDENGQSVLNELDNPQSRLLPKHEYFAFQAQAYALIKQWEPALNSINQAIELQKQNEKYWEIRANIYFQVSDYTMATNDFTKALSLNPYNPALYLKRAESSRMAGNIKLATEDLAIYQQLYPEKPETIYQLGKLEAARENYPESIKYFTRLLGFNKSNPQYFIERGLTYFQIENYQSADEDFGMALDLNPTLQEAYLYKGKIKLYLLDMDGACYNFEKAKSYGNSEASKLYTHNCK
jgi:tetratricopeptide (TPR) repeat protein